MGFWTRRRIAFVVSGVVAAIVLAGVAFAAWGGDPADPVDAAAPSASTIATSAPIATTTTQAATTTTSTLAPGMVVVTGPDGSVIGTAPEATVPPTPPVAVAAGVIVAPGDGVMGSWREGDDPQGYYEDISVRIDANPQQAAIWLLRQDADGGVFPEARLGNGTGSASATRRLFLEFEEEQTTTLLLVAADPTLDAYYESWLEQDIEVIAPVGVGNELDAATGTCCRAFRPVDA